jgi:purine-binding chemotaxis protein CheW
MKPPVQLLIFLLDERPYALRLSHVNRAVRAVDWTPLPQVPEQVLGAIDLQGQIVPLLNIRSRFGLPRRDVRADDQFIIAHTSRRIVALPVDCVKSVAERSADEIIAAQRILPRLDQIEGAVQLEDGLTLIYDLNRFLSLDEERVLDQALALEATHA